MGLAIQDSVEEMQRLFPIFLKTKVFFYVLLSNLQKVFLLLWLKLVGSEVLLFLACNPRKTHETQSRSRDFFVEANWRTRILCVALKKTNSLLIRFRNIT